MRANRNQLPKLNWLHENPDATYSDFAKKFNLSASSAYGFCRYRNIKLTTDARREKIKRVKKKPKLNIYKKGDLIKRGKSVFEFITHEFGQLKCHPVHQGKTRTRTYVYLDGVAG